MVDWLTFLQKCMVDWLTFLQKILLKTNLSLKNQTHLKLTKRIPVVLPNSWIKLLGKSVIGVHDDMM